MKKLSDDEKAKLQAKIEQERTERIQLITESFSDSPISRGAGEPSTCESEQSWVAYAIYLIALLVAGFLVRAIVWTILSVIEALLPGFLTVVGIFIFASTIVFLLVVLPFFAWRNRWRKQSWEGVVIGKSWEIHHSRHSSWTTYYVEVCYDQTIQKRELSEERWESVEIGDYIVKKSGNKSIEKRAIQEKEAKEATYVIIGRLLHAEEKICSRGLTGRLLRVEGESRSRAVDALAKIGVPDAPALIAASKNDVPALMEILKNKDVGVRRYAVGALGRTGDERAIPALIEALKDKKKVRQSAVQALDQIGEPASAIVPPLIKALSDKYPKVRINAVEALRQIGTPEAKEAVKKWS